LIIAVCAIHATLNRNSTADAEPLLWSRKFLGFKFSAHAIFTKTARENFSSRAHFDSAKRQKSIASKSALDLITV
jgi:hypothetical protein